MSDEPEISEEMLNVIIASDGGRATWYGSIGHGTPVYMSQLAREILRLRAEVRRLRKLEAVVLKARQTGFGAVKLEAESE